MRRVLLAALLFATTAASAEDFDSAWRRLRQQYPETKAYRPASGSDALLRTLLGWVRNGDSATVYDRQCHPISVRRKGDQLYGLIHQKTTIDDDTKSVHADEILFGDTITVTCGFDERFRKAKDGQWISDGTSALSCADTVGLHLSRVTEEAAWFNTEPVRLGFGCSHVLNESMSCKAGGSRQCAKCLGWGIQASSSEPHHGRGTAVRVEKGQAPGVADCTTPCAAMIAPEQILRTRETFAGRSFETDGSEKHPFLFRTLDACRRYVAAHRIAKQDASPW